MKFEMTRETLLKQYDQHLIDFPTLAEKLKEITPKEHDACEKFSDAVLDDLSCGYRSCVDCGKLWYFCAFCKIEDLESEDELSEHLAKRHPEEICEHEMTERGSIRTCDLCDYQEEKEFEDPDR